MILFENETYGNIFLKVGVENDNLRENILRNEIPMVLLKQSCIMRHFNGWCNLARKTLPSVVVNPYKRD